MHKSIARQAEHKQNILADVERDIEYYVNPAKEDVPAMLEELWALILREFKQEDGAGIVSYGYRKSLHAKYASMHIVGQNDMGQYKLVRFFSSGRKWATTTDVPWGSVNDVLDHMMGNWLS